MESKPVIKEILSNGLTILIKPSHNIPKVSTQMWYDVGSKDEKTGEKGIAHLIEHMIFKGTKRLSECDINLITHKLSGYTNAFTSYDYTGYLFDFPSQHWHEALPLLADCMVNCTFKDQYLSSELKAVIQELKMYRDDYTSSLIESMLAAIFPDHPYHHPIIGYKQDLWSVSRETLIKFYQYHYRPNNATLVMVGDLDPKDAIKHALKEFGHLQPNKEYEKEKFYHTPDLKQQSVTLFREISVPFCVLAWMIPGATTKNDYLVELINWIIGSGKGSRLYRKLVDELQIVTDLETFNYDLFDYGLFFIYFQPKEGSLVDDIIEHINQELALIAKEGVNKQEFTRAVKQVEVEHLALLENIQKQAYSLGKFYLATGDEQYLYTYTHQAKEHMPQAISEFVATYLRPAVMHKGQVLPLPKEEKAYWLELQELSDQLDQKILSGRVREEVLEGGRCVLNIEVKEPQPFTFPRAQSFHISNGLKVLYYNNDSLPKIDIVVESEVKQTYDPEGKEGLCYFVASLLTEGTKNYPGEQFSTTAESFGMTIQATAGQITLSMLAEDLPTGLELFHEMVVNATLTPEAIEKVRSQILAELREFWDTPMQFTTQIARQEIYKNHPYSKHINGTIEGISNISREDIVSFYHQYYSPRAMRLALVGDVSRYDLEDLFENLLGKWHGKTIEKLVYPPIEPVTPREIDYPILRDQTTLCYAGLSLERMSADFDALLLFDNIFTGGPQGSMASKLFDLREQSGLFYTIGGSLLARSDEQKGLIIIKTLVSNDRLKEAEVAIERAINTATQSIEDSEFKEAQQVVINSLVDNFGSNYQIATTLLFKDKFNLPADYYDTRASLILSITKQQMLETAKKYLNTNKFILVRAGRI